MIKKDIKNIKLKFAISHFLLSLLLLSSFSLAYTYHIHNKKLDSVKKSLVELSYNIKTALEFEDLDNIEYSKTFFAGIIDKKNRIIFGNLPDTKIQFNKTGFAKSKKYLFYITEPREKNNPYKIITAYDIQGLNKTFFATIALYIFLSIALSIMYGYFAYYLSGKWLKSVEKSYRNLEEFTEMFSHEVLTPVSSALFYIEDKSVRESLMKSKEFLSNFLNFQKQQAFPWRKKSVSIKEMVDLIEKEFSFVIDKKQIYFDKSIKVDKISSNPESIYLILKNTIENAIKYSDNKSTITVSSNTNQGKIEIKIQNSAKNKDISVDKFKSQDGFGLGFYITKKAVESLNGKMLISEEKEQITITIILKV